MAAQWCGAAGTTPWLAHSPSPCWMETADAAVLLALGAPLLVHALHRLHTSCPTTCSKRGLTGFEVTTLGLCVTLALLHALHLAAAAALLRGLPFHIGYHAAAAALWAAAATTAAAAGGRHAPLDLRALGATASLLYTISIWAYMGAYLAGGVFPVTYIKSQIWTSMLAAATSTLLTVVEAKKPRHQQHTGNGYTALPDGTADVEAAAGAQAEERTWASLFADACSYAWPASPRLQLRVVLCVLLLLFMRVLNLAVPIFYKNLIDRLAAAGSAGGGGGGFWPAFWDLVAPWEVAYLAALFFQGGAGGGITGFVNNLRQWLWIPVGQDAYRRVSLTVFSHVLDLDLGFHLSRKTGEVTRVLDRGTNAIQSVLSTIVFQIAPQIIDMLAAATYLAGAVEPWVALIVFVTIGSYIPLTIIVTEWRGNFRRTMNNTSNAASARITDALLNWETVKYFNNERLEEDRYAQAIDAYQGAEYSFSSSLNVLNTIQSGIMFAGISAGILLVTGSVAAGHGSVGDVVLFLTLMAQLYGPLNFFGTYYRIIQQYMIDMENLLQLLDTKGKVSDAADAKPLVLTQGEVAFKDVWFTYPGGANVLKGVSFHVRGGSTVALVGATGSGKSTLTRLLFRFFDVSSGSITVDGQDLRAITQSSLRAVIGMVPQDCVLFNDTISYNIRYGRPGASDAEVEAAAAAAAIHDAITTRFPKAYDTIVGERGLRLSGGEKQRVAFARALLKNPALLVLDEATSALDTITEKRIQAALASARSDRTTFIVAHRLSTISDADLIVVLREGCVAEAGSHEDLLSQQGLYAELWSKQAAGGGPSGGEGSTAGSAPSSARGSLVSLAELAEQRPAGGAVLSPSAGPPRHHGH